MKADRGLTVERMVELARVSRASFYRFEENAGIGPMGIWICAMRSSGSRWNGRATDGGGSPRSYTGAAGR